MQKFLDGLVSHYVFDEGRLVVAHAGMKEEMQGRGSAKVRDFALFGETTGETDEFGLPVRYNWASEYRGRAERRLRPHAGAGAGMAQPHDQHRYRLRLRRPADGAALAGEGARVGAGARRPTPNRSGRSCPPPHAPALSAQQANDDLLDIDDVRGKRLITTRLHRNVTIREENAAAALEVMSRFAANPKWLIYLPPTMSPSETTQARRPARASGRGVLRTTDPTACATVVVEQKHMGSRAILIVCRSKDVARERFGVLEDEEGICYTRTGRRFFEDAALERELLATVQTALDRERVLGALQHRLGVPRLRADAVVGEGAGAGAPAVRLGRNRGARRPGRDGRRARLAAARGIDVARCSSGTRFAPDLADRFARAYRHYCWPVESLRDIRIAPFHVMATEGAVHTRQGSRLAHEHDSAALSMRTTAC